MKLAFKLDRGDGNINYMDFIRKVKAANDKLRLQLNLAGCVAGFEAHTSPSLSCDEGNIQEVLLDSSSVSGASVTTSASSQWGEHIYSKKDKPRSSKIQNSTVLSTFGGNSTDRASWIEEVVRNSMRDVAHRYETARCRKISGPKVLHLLALLDVLVQKYNY